MQTVDKTLERTFISEVKDSQDETILLRGWVYKIIDLSNIVFVKLRDKSGIIQLVTNKEQIESIISNIRNKIPNVVLRTSLIVGFPGETDDDFRELEEFVEKTKFDKLGTFMYSKEEGTPAARLPEQIHGNTKKSRYNKIMSIQQKVSNENLKNKIGKNVEVLIEDISFDGKYLIGRTSQDVPEEDGIIYVENNNFESKVNSFVNVKVTEVKEYDLIGKIV